MAYDEALANRIREALLDLPNVEEKKMFGGLCFMVNDKMCAGVLKDEMICKFNPDINDEVLMREGCRPFDFSVRSMKGFVYVSEKAIRTQKDFDYWINLCLEYNKIAKAKKKK